MTKLTTIVSDFDSMHSTVDALGFDSCYKQFEYAQLGMSNCVNLVFGRVQKDVDITAYNALLQDFIAEVDEMGQQNGKGAMRNVSDVRRYLVDLCEWRVMGMSCHPSFDECALWETHEAVTKVMYHTDLDEAEVNEWVSEVVSEMVSLVRKW